MLVKTRGRPEQAFILRTAEDPRTRRFRWAVFKRVEYGTDAPNRTAAWSHAQAVRRQLEDDEATR